MSLQISSMNALNLNKPAVGEHYNFKPSDTHLDSITSQITKTQDAALQVMELMENGRAAKFWEAQKQMPAATWLGNLMDRLMGWGKYYPERSENEGAQKRAEGRPHECPYLNNTNFDIVRDYLNTSYAVHSHPNQTCSLQEPVPYWIEMFQIIFRPVNAEDAICRIAYCIKDRFDACYPSCWPCQNATESEIKNMLNTTSNLTVLESAFDYNLNWVYLVQTSYRSPNRTMLNQWKLTQIHKIFDDTRISCENEILHPHNKPEMQGLYALLIIPVLGAFGTAYLLYKYKKADPSYEPIGSAVN